ncbi:MAG: hypothetical protein ACYDCX_09345 [Acidithiobacillus sp.]
MSTAREIVQEIIGAGGHLWFDGDRVRGRNIPRRLAMQVKADEGAILAALLSAPAHDDYAIEERLAIQEEEKLPLDRGWADVAGFEGLPDLTPAQHGAILHRLMNPPPPATVTCGSCAEFEQGLEPNSLGRCSRTADGLPPVASRGYGVCFPAAPRLCPNYQEAV